MHAVYGPSESKCLVLSPTVGSNDKVGKKCLLLYVEGEKKRSFRSDPAFAVISAGDRDTLWLTLTHTDQRGQKTELGSGGPKKISYKPSGFTVLVHRSSDLGNDMIDGSALIPHERDEEDTAPSAEHA